MAEKYRTLEEGSSRHAMEMADELLRDPQVLVRDFAASVRDAEAFYGSQSGEDRFAISSKRKQLPNLSERPPEIDGTPAVGALLQARGDLHWPVTGDETLNFFYVDREIKVTHSAELDPPLPDTRPLGMAADLLLASADGTGTPIVGELKVTTEDGPDENPFYALIQALANATYLLPESQQRRLPPYNRRRIKVDSGRLDVYVLLAGGLTGGGEPVASDVWFTLRDRAEVLSAAVIDGLADWIRTIAFLELSWLPLPGGRQLQLQGQPIAHELMRDPRITKRFAVRSVV